MKKLIFLALLSLPVVASTFAQNKKSKQKKQASMRAPAAITDAFNLKFGDVSPKWQETTLGNYVAVFEKDSIKNEATFDNAGTFLKVKTFFNGEQIPEKIASAIRTNFPNATIVEGKKVVIGERAPYFDVVIKDGDKQMSILSDEEGVLSSTGATAQVTVPKTQ
jgi:hypothetical protein